MLPLCADTWATARWSESVVDDEDSHLRKALRRPPRRVNQPAAHGRIDAPRQREGTFHRVDGRD
jgi:hypothetical protein